MKLKGLVLSAIGRVGEGNGQGKLLCGNEVDVRLRIPDGISG